MAKYLDPTMAGEGGGWFNRHRDGGRWALHPRLEGCPACWFNRVNTGERDPLPSFVDFDPDKGLADSPLGET